MILMLTRSGRSKYMSLLCYDIDVEKGEDDEGGVRMMTM